MNIAVLGPRGSGKTCFLYLMVNKLRKARLERARFHDFKDNGTHNEVKKSISRGDWPDPGAHDEDDDGYTPPHSVQFNFKVQSFLKPVCRLVIPERSGIVFEKYSEVDLCDKTGRPQNWSIFKDDEKAAVAECRHLVDKSHGIILVLDMENIRKEDKAAHVGHYESFINNLKKNHANVIGRCPLLVLLNKSDLVHKERESMYAIDEARDYLDNDSMLSNLVGEIESAADGPIVWAWHSTTSKIIRTRSGVIKPNYDAYHSVDADLYSRSFVRFLTLVNGR